MADVQTLAGEAYDSMESRQRGPDETIYTLKDDAPEWVRDIVHKAHGGLFLPDDWRYETIMDAFSAIHDNGDDDEDGAFAFADNVDVYTHDLTRWYASNLNRASYCDEAVAEGLVERDADITRRIALGQYVERQEVYAQVLSGLRARVEELEDVEA